MSELFYHFFTATAAFIIGYYLTNYIRIRIKKEGGIKKDDFLKLRGKWFWYFMFVSVIAFIIIKVLTRGWIS